MRDICFTPIAFEECNDWATENKKVQKKIAKLIEECPKNPFEGTIRTQTSIKLKFHKKNIIILCTICFVPFTSKAQNAINNIQVVGFAEIEIEPDVL
jgi:YoeB-like toxin of bacterial type II toxin-antitoxin system